MLEMMKRITGKGLKDYEHDILHPHHPAAIHERRNKEVSKATTSYGKPKK